MLALAACASGSSSGALAQPILIDFESIPGMLNVPGSLVPEASRLRDQFLAMHGVRFSSGSEFVAVVVHGAATPSGTQLLGGTTEAGHLTYNQSFPVTVRFFDPTGATPAVVNDVSIRGDLTSVPGTKTIRAFDVNGTEIASQTLNDSDPEPLRITLPSAIIHRVQFTSTSATVGWDDLRFTAPVLACAITCPADLNCDRAITSADVTLYINRWFSDLANGTETARFGTSPPTPVGSPDLTNYLAAWFSGIAAPGGC